MRLLPLLLPLCVAAACIWPASQTLPWPACLPPPCPAGEGWQLGDNEEGEGEERDTEPTPLHRPKRFDDLRGGGGSEWPQRRIPLEGGPGYGGRGMEEATTPEQLEQQRKQRQLEAAVKKLEKQGAQVGRSVQQMLVSWEFMPGRGAGPCPSLHSFSAWQLQPCIAAAAWVVWCLCWYGACAAGANPPSVMVASRHFGQRPSSSLFHDFRRCLCTIPSSLWIGASWLDMRSRRGRLRTACCWHCCTQVWWVGGWRVGAAGAAGTGAALCRGAPLIYSLCQTKCRGLQRYRKGHPPAVCLQPPSSCAVRRAARHWQDDLSTHHRLTGVWAKRCGALLHGGRAAAPGLRPTLTNTAAHTRALLTHPQAAVPLVYIPLEAVVSKWYGESEKMLAGACGRGGGWVGWGDKWVQAKRCCGCVWGGGGSRRGVVMCGSVLEA